MSSQFLRKKLRELFLICTVGLILVTIVFFGGTPLEAKDSKYPAGSLQLIVPHHPGSSTDLVPRFMAPKLSKVLGVPVNVVNKPGGLGVGGTLEAVKSAPDGKTVLVECPATTSVYIAWLNDLPFKVEERTFLARAVVLDFSIVVTASSPYRSLQDIEQVIRKNPASFKWGLIGASPTDVAISQFKAALASRGVDLSQTRTVTYQSGTPTVTGLAGGHIDIYAGSLGLVHTFLNAGKVRAIAVTGAERSKFFPGVPTAAEQGFPSITTRFWVGYSAPPGLPKNIVNTLVTHIKEIVNAPEMISEWDKVGAIPAFLAGEDFRKFIMNEAEEFKASGGK